MDASLHVGKGWAPIVQTAVDKIEALGAKIFQVKEKFGELRIYTSTCDEDILNIVDSATRQCSVTCEDCGAPGELRDFRGWLRTCCLECSRK